MCDVYEWFMNSKNLFSRIAVFIFMWALFLNLYINIINSYRHCYCLQIQIWVLHPIEPNVSHHLGDHFKHRDSGHRDSLR